MENHYFAGSFKQLFEHWSSSEKPKRFQTGGTRTKAVQKAIRILELHTDLSGLFLDGGCGAGYPASLLLHSHPTTKVIGMDFSFPMIHVAQHVIPTPLIGSILNHPLKKESIDVWYSFFVLSDYHDLSRFISQLVQSLRRNGFFVLLDYGKNDEYWNLRQTLHGLDGVKGNVFLRSEHDLVTLLPHDFQLVYHETISYKVETHDIPSFSHLYEIGVKHKLLKEKKVPQRLVRSFILGVWKKKG